MIISSIPKVEGKREDNRLVSEVDVKAYNPPKRTKLDENWDVNNDPPIIVGNNC